MLDPAALDELLGADSPPEGVGRLGPAAFIALRSLAIAPPGDPLAFLAVAPAAHAAGSFVEPVRVIHTFTGVQDGYLGWAVSELADIDGDGVTDLIAGEPNTPDAAGNTWVYSGRTGGVLHKFAGAPGDNQGYAVADAGDTDGDGVHDVITGAPNVDPAAGPGVAYLYSGRTGSLLRLFRGAHRRPARRRGGERLRPGPRRSR